MIEHTYQAFGHYHLMEILSRYTFCSQGQSNGLFLKPSNDSRDETFEKCSILVKIKEGEDFNHRNISNISRIKI